MYANLWKRLLDQGVATLKDSTLTIVMSEEEAQRLRELFEAEKAELEALNSTASKNERIAEIADLDAKISVLPVKAVVEEII